MGNAQYGLLNKRWPWKSLIWTHEHKILNATFIDSTTFYEEIN